MTDYTGFSTEALIQEAISDLECIIVQALPSDSQIVMDHVYAAHKALVATRPRIVTAAEKIRQLTSEVAALEHDLQHPHAYRSVPSVATDSTDPLVLPWHAQFVGGTTYCELSEEDLSK